MRFSHKAQRGSALLAVVALSGVLLGIALAVLYYAGQQRRRAVNEARLTTREGCAQAGLQLARSYFGRSFAGWNSYLASPGRFNPVRTDDNPTPADPGDAALRASNPEVFADLDGDGAPDVFLYIRDNEDELPPAAPNWRRDNDQVVVVGALCVSRTLAPRREDNSVDSDALLMEGLLDYNVTGSVYRAQGTGGATGSGNLN